MYSNGIKRILHGFDKLRQAHDPLIPMCIHFLPVQSLYGHFSKMLFNTEIDLSIGRSYKLFIGDSMIIILIVSKYILHNVVEFVRILVENMYQCLLYLLFLEQLVTIIIELRKDLQHALPNEMSETIVRKTEFVCSSSRNVSYPVGLGWHQRSKEGLFLGIKYIEKLNNLNKSVKYKKTRFAFGLMVEMIFQ